MEEVLLKCMHRHQAHVAPHGQSNRLYENVHMQFISDLPVPIWKRIEKPTVKALRDKYRTMARGRSQYLASVAGDEHESEATLLFCLMVSSTKKEELTKTRRETQEQVLTRESALETTGNALREQDVRRISELDALSEPAPKRTQRIMESHDIWE